MNTRHTLELTGILSMGACSVIFAALWWTAVITNNPIRMTITQYGERYPEASLWFLIGLLMLFALYSYLRRLRRRTRDTTPSEPS